MDSVMSVNQYRNNKNRGFIAQHNLDNPGKRGRDGIIGPALTPNDFVGDIVIA